MDSTFFGAVDKRPQTVGISGGEEDDSVNAAPDELFEGLGVIHSQGANRAVHQLNPELRDPASFIQDAAPELIVKKVDLSWDTDANAAVGF